VTPVVFAHFLNERLKAWRHDTYGSARTEEDQNRTDPAARTLRLEQPLPGTSSSEGGDLTLEDTLAHDLNAAGSSWSMAADDDEAAAGTARVEEAPDAVGPDGTEYRLIHQTARRLGATVKQLRHIEKAGGYTPLRAKDVPGSSHRCRPTRACTRPPPRRTSRSKWRCCAVAPTPAAWLVRS
jgi:hypothetical protein